MVEPHAPVVHAVLTHLRAVILDANAGQDAAIFIAQRHDERVHAVALAVGGFELRKHRCRAPVADEVADVVLAGGPLRAVDDEPSRGWVEAGERFEVAHVGAVADLGHGEAAGQREAADVAQVFFVVRRAAEQTDAARPQAELHGELDGETDVVKRDGFKCRRERRVVVLPAAFAWQPERADALGGEFAAPAGGEFALGGDGRVARFRVKEGRAREDVALYPLADGGLVAVEESLQRGGIEGGGRGGYDEGEASSGKFAQAGGCCNRRQVGSEAAVR